ncbi:DUF305 domain-containing protein [Mycolicibacterium fortuitum]|uniref:Lipoprotein n=1 Tax=Mycolicibacterium fortuitum subsp. fortuitum DSM 46621 = ATCC 6841 = JCM 6387 TaxID=1214102 RepID=K0UWA4_MYCFO|nr:DUF305 domain-containing protein [Mycolicibacterium fortuitum]AIY47746.1 protein of unknown function DUF305 [Mycobacterium sp. VKM Ac-1817D]CRL79435.1 lipoprotein [Mycolicibacter nonchromogenicus]EJZ11086.1 lipoprotein [Mycolicibacterium fortuitum subsp. fortuitum DSM 46621 = ATCC 6841 = JCM 6387]OBG53886.1 DUF305 domain-containing protein [Mycolicibacterium fortuitum]WEV31295.1 DUF305 domain-containing protein [Mycolicibacterium fortuitum]
MTKLMMLSAGAVVAAALVAGCSNQSTDGAAKTSATSATSASASPQTPGAQDAAAHNDADVMFAQHMIPHHQQAVEMSDVLLAKQGIDPRVSELATQIKGAQAPEIEQMQGWLKQWGNPPMPSMSQMPQQGHGDMGHANMGHGDMPAMQGMVSEADMTALRNAQGAEAAKLYLTHMIAHHEGAITMAEDEIKDGQYAAAVEMAHAIVKTQQQEIDTMRQILGSL